MVVCGRRWGKTRLGVRLALEHAAKRRRVWWVGPVYQVSGIAWRLLCRIAKRIPGIEIRKTDRCVVFPGGGEVWFKSSDNEDNLRGEGLDFLVMDEADYQEESAWSQVLRAALADRRGSALFISTPRQDGGWFHKAAERGETAEGQADGWASWSYPSASNPHLSPAEIEAAARDLDPVTFAREFLAQFVATPDAIYHTFSRRIHERPCPFAFGQRVFVGVDFNNTPRVAVFFQRHGTEFWGVGEVYHTGQLDTYEHAELIADWLIDHGVLPDEKRRFRREQALLICDASGKSLQHAGKTDHGMLAERGFVVDAPPANPFIRDRDNTVLAHLKNGKGEARLFFDPSCKKTIEAFSKLVRKGRDRSPYSHSTDAAGYVLHRLAPVLSGGRSSRPLANL